MDESAACCIWRICLNRCFIAVQLMLPVPQHENRGPQLCTFNKAAVKAVKEMQRKTTYGQSIHLALSSHTVMHNVMINDVTIN